MGPGEGRTSVHPSAFAQLLASFQSSSLELTALMPLYGEGMVFIFPEYPAVGSIANYAFKELSIDLRCTVMPTEPSYDLS